MFLTKCWILYFIIRRVLLGAVLTPWLVNGPTARECFWALIVRKHNFIATIHGFLSYFMMYILSCGSVWNLFKAVFIVLQRRILTCPLWLTQEDVYFFKTFKMFPCTSSLWVGPKLTTPYWAPQLIPLCSSGSRPSADRDPGCTLFKTIPIDATQITWFSALLELIWRQRRVEMVYKSPRTYTGNLAFSLWHILTTLL